MKLYKFDLLNHETIYYYTEDVRMIEDRWQSHDGFYELTEIKKLPKGATNVQYLSHKRLFVVKYPMGAPVIYEADNIEQVEKVVNGNVPIEYVGWNIRRL